MPMKRATSLIAWESLKRSNELSKKQWAVYDMLFRHGPLSAREVNSMIAPGHTSVGYHKRLSELQRMGLVREAGVRRCQYSGRQVIKWDVTSSERVQELPKRRRRSRRPLVDRILEMFLDLALRMEGEGLASAAQMVRDRVDSIRNPKEEGSK